MQVQGTAADALPGRLILQANRFCDGAAHDPRSCTAVSVPGLPEKSSASADEHAHGAPVHMGWARLLERVFDLDLVH